MKRFSLLYRVLAAYLAVLIPILLVMAGLFSGNREEMERLIVSELTQMADEREAYILMYLEASRNRIRDFASDGLIVESLEEGGPAGELGDYMRRYKLPIVKEVYRLSIITAADGRVVASTAPGIEGEDRSKEEFFKRGLSGLSVTQTASPLGPEIAVSAPIYSRVDGGRVLGVITGFTELARFGDFFTGEYIRRLGALTWNHWGRWATFDTYLVGSGRLMLTQSRFVPGSVLRQSVDTLPVRWCMERGREVTGRYKDFRGRQVVGASMCFPEYGWTLVAEVEEKEAFAPVAGSQRLAYAAVSAVALLTGALVLYFILAIVRRLKALALVAGEIAAGNYGARAFERAGGEIGLLASSFNAMAGSIGHRTQELMDSKMRLADSELRYRTLIENLQEGIWVVDDNEMTTFVNPRMAEMLGTTVAGMAGTSIYDYKDEAGARLLKERLVSVRRGVKLFVDAEFVRKDGSRRYFSVSAAPLVEGGVYRGAIAGIVDMTERKKAEDALKESQERFRAILDSMGNIVYMKDLEGRHLFVNRFFELATGMKKEEVYGKTSFDIFPQEAAARFDANDRKALEAGGAVEFEEPVRLEAGERTFLSIKFPLKDTSGKTYAVCGVSTDITGLKEAEEALRKSEQSLRQAQRIAHIGNWEWDMLERRLRTSGEVLRIFGIRGAPPEKDGDYLGLIHPGDRDEVWRAFEEAVRTGRRCSVDARITRGDGKERIVHLQGEILKDASGAPARISGTVQDITERKTAEQEAVRLARELEQRVEERTADLKRANEELAAAKAEMEAFTYSAAHDLRAPLRLVDGFTALLIRKQRDRLTGEGIDHLERIRAASQRMGQLIDDLMDLSFVMRAEVASNRVDLSAMAASIALDLERAAPERKAAFSIQEGLEATGDERLLRMVLENLLGNAWKFTMRTSEPRIEFLRVREEGGAAVFCVKDNGIGFDMAHAGRLFRPFERLHSHDEFPGTGMGLATVARAVQRHGGKVWAEGAPGAGASFCFTIEKEGG